ncbi:UNVERIFIED_CONTAM: hypothetical protein Sradi_0318400 [Sesamum radiatum]|uniref:Uncharacterized protein n=1 Tax=Sesamum radiatum TaxID=300843 RepID=A0AAW2W3A2_SESRA
MKEGTLMRVLFCKIQCPFICFCKSSAAHLYTSGPLKLENSPHVVPSTAFALSSASDKSSSGIKEDGLIGKQGAENVLKSCIRKIPYRSEANKEVGKKRVQWMDNLGKELAETKEFESRC